MQSKIVTPKRLTNLTSSHSAMEDSQGFDSEEEANQTCPSPTTDSESEGEEVNLKSCLDVLLRSELVFMGDWFMTRKVSEVDSSMWTTKEESKAQ